MKFVEGINPALRVVARCDEGAYLAAGEDWISLGITPKTREGPLQACTHLALRHTGEIHAADRRNPSLYR